MDSLFVPFLQLRAETPGLPTGAGEGAWANFAWTTSTSGQMLPSASTHLPHSETDRPSAYNTDIPTPAAPPVPEADGVWSNFSRTTNMSDQIISPGTSSMLTPPANDLPSIHASVPEEAPPAYESLFGPDGANSMSPCPGVAFPGATAPPPPPLYIECISSNK